MGFRKPYLLILMMTYTLCISAQTVDIEQLAKAKPFQISGNVAADMMYSLTDAPLLYDAPAFQYFLKGSLAATFFGQLTVPVSFSYSNRKFDTRYPKNQQSFNRLGLSPKYKWITAHGGWSNMRFSRYSLNGHRFVGGGIELRPKDLEIKAMHGRLLKAVFPHTTATGRSNRPVFERWGTGLMVAHNSQGNRYGMSVFRSTDNYMSIPGGLDSLGITPEENLVLSFDLRHQFNDRLSGSVEYANSQITADSRVGDEAVGFFNDHVGIYTNTTTNSHKAIKADLGYKIQKMTFGVGVERVGPGYKSHGAYFFNSDFENVTVSFASPFLENKLNLNTSVGLERDNVARTRTSSANRVIGQLNLSWVATEKLQFNGNYSNFRNVSEFNPYAGIPSANPYDNIDSLRFAQVSKNASLNTVYNTQSETLGHSLMLMVGAMQTDAELGGVAQNTGADYYNSTMSYNMNYIPKKISATLSCNFNRMVSPDLQNTMLGPTAGINTVLFKVINSGLMYTWNTTLGQGNMAQNIQRLQYMASCVLKEKHNLNFSAVWSNRDMMINAGEWGKRNEFLGRVGYGYQL